jgi:hypothetical protein
MIFVLGGGGWGCLSELWSEYGSRKRVAIAGCRHWLLEDLGQLDGLETWIGEPYRIGYIGPVT